MIKFIIDKISDQEFESQLIDGYGIKVFYRVVNQDSDDLIQTGTYNVKVSAKTSGRTMGQMVSGEFKALWTRRLIYYLFHALKEFTQGNPLPKTSVTFSGDDYAWWNSIPANWMEVELVLGE